MVLYANINEITYIQILSYFGYKETYRTSWYIQYTNSNMREYAVFKNINNDGGVAVIDIITRSIITKSDLLYTLSPTFLDNSIIDKIKKIDNYELNLADTSTYEEVVKGLLMVNVLAMSNDYLKNYVTNNFLFNGEFNQLYQDREHNIILPLEDNNKVVNYYIINKTSEQERNTLRFQRANGGVYISKLSSQVDSLLISFDFNDVMYYFQKELTFSYLTVIPNNRVNYELVQSTNSMIEAGCKEIDQLPITKILFVYNSSKASDMVSVLKYFLFYCTLKSDYTIYFSQDEDNRITLKLYTPPGIDLIAVMKNFNTLNQIVLDRLNIPPITKGESPEIAQARKEIKEKSFTVWNIPVDNNYIQYVSFAPKIELIEIFMNSINNFIFEGDSSINFQDVTNLGDKEEEEHSDFTSLL